MDRFARSGHAASAFPVCDGTGAVHPERLLGLWQPTGRQWRHRIWHGGCQRRAHALSPAHTVRPHPCAAVDCAARHKCWQLHSLATLRYDADAAHVCGQFHVIGAHGPFRPRVKRETGALNATRSCNACAAPATVNAINCVIKPLGLCALGRGRSFPVPRKRMSPETGRNAIPGGCAAGWQRDALRAQALHAYTHHLLQ
jgi:hypothetical protein